MHSMKEKFKFFMKVQHELYDIIGDGMELGLEMVIKMMQKHLDNYNSKNSVYRFTLTEEDEFSSEYKFIMSERVSYKLKPVYQDIIPVKDVIRNKKLDSLLD
jgi:hypothetical protein